MFVVAAAAADVCQTFSALMAPSNAPNELQLVIKKTETARRHASKSSSVESYSANPTECTATNSAITIENVMMLTVSMTIMSAEKKNDPRATRLDGADDFESRPMVEGEPPRCPKSVSRSTNRGEGGNRTWARASKSQHRLDVGSIGTPQSSKLDRRSRTPPPFLPLTSVLPKHTESVGAAPPLSQHVA